MASWSATKVHEEANLTLLCPLHHREKTAGLLDYDQVLRANSDPINLRVGHSQEPWKIPFDSSTLEFGIGSNFFDVPAASWQHGWSAIRVDDLQLIGAKVVDRAVLLSMHLCDANNDPLLVVRDGEARVFVNADDIRIEGRRLLINSGGTMVEIEFIPPNHVWLKRGILRLNGVHFKIDQNSIFCINARTTFERCHFVSAPNGIHIGADPYLQDGCVHISPVERLHGRDFTPKEVRLRRQVPRSHQFLRCLFQAPLNINPERDGGRHRSAAFSYCTFRGSGQSRYNLASIEA